MSGEWTQAPLGEFFRLTRRSCLPFNYPDTEFYHYSLPAYDECSGPMVQYGSAIESNKTLINVDAVLVSKLNPRKPRVQVALVQNSGLTSCASTEFMVYQPQALDVSLQFYARYFAGDEFSRHLEQVATGTTNSHVRVRPSETLTWYAPQPPLREQRRIAEILDTLDRTIEATQRIISKLQATRQGLLHDLLTRGLDEHGKLRDPQRHPEQFKDTALGRLPVGWDLTSLLEHVELPSGQVDPKQEPYSSMPLIAADHIETRTGRLLKIETAKQQEAISGKYLFESDDVLYSKIRPNLRKAVLIGFDGICSADMYPLRSKETMHSGYLILIILGEDFSRFAEAVSMRSGFPKINRLELGEFRLFLPSYEEQRRIAAKIKGIDESTLHEQAQLAKLQTLKRGLMEDLLTGRVRVAVGEKPA